MKQAIKKGLEKFPFLYSAVTKGYRLMRPEKQSLSALQEKIIGNLADKKSVFFVQVGSNDGVQGDPLFELINTHKHWRGVFIEPVKFLYDKLKTNYHNSDRFIFENKAIVSDSKNAPLEFFYVSKAAEAGLKDELPFWYDQLGSFDKNHILKHLDGRLEPYIVAEKVQTTSLQDLFKQHDVSHIDLLHIDTEGYDYQVLSTLNFEQYKPSIVLYEHIHLCEKEKDAAEQLLKNHGYQCTQIAGDTLAIT